ncbi:MAG: HDOD domain-containing protein [Ignavibacteriales bacterium]
MDIELFNRQEKREKTELVLSNVYNLPAIPTIMMEISRLLEKPSTTTAELAKVIGRDQGIASKVLSIANSPLYGLPRKVSTIDFAILIIGYQDIKNIITALSMVESFKNKTDKNLNQKEFWLHSIMTGLASKKLAEDLGYRSGSEAFVAGLIHDLGIPVIHKYFHTNFIVICEKVNTSKISYMEAEFDTLGLSHQEIGRFLAVKWNLPLALCDTILNHHTPQLANENKTLTSIVHLADYATHKLNVGHFYWDGEYLLDNSILETFKFNDMAQLDKFVNGYKDLFVQEANTLRI